jgi:hypothetical protein
VTDSTVLDWLLEPENPSAYYLTLTHLLNRPADDPEVVRTQAAVPTGGPAKAILDAQWPDGYWMRPGIGYSPKHKATVWQVIFLAALGAPRTEAIDRACAYILDHNRLPDGRFSAYKSAKGAFACLNGNLLRAMLQLGYEDSRIDESLEVLAEMVLQDEFRCRANAAGPPPARMCDGLPCAWGAIKVLGVLAHVPKALRSPTVQTAIEAGIELLLSYDLAGADYPTGTEPSPLWHKFGFPLGYTSDLLEALEVLARLGLGRDARLVGAVEFVTSKQSRDGRWVLEYTPDNTWGKFGELGQPNKWVTLRALGVLKGWSVIV